MMVLGLGAIDQSIVATALPRIMSDLGGLTRLTWVVSAYVLASTSTMPLYGKLSDQYGRKPMIYIAIITFLVGSALSGAAQSLSQLILFRVIQGFGAGGLLPLTQIIIGDLVEPAKRGRKQGMISAVFAVCSVLGPVLGGVITDLLSWHWIFYVNLPIGAAALLVIAKALRRPQRTQVHRIDYFGALLLTACTTMLLLILTLGGAEWPWRSARIGALCAGTALLGVVFVLHLRRAREPVLPLDLFRNRVFVVACAVMAFTFMGMLGASVFFPLFFQIVKGTSPSNSGLLTSALTIGVVVSSVISGRILFHSGRYKPAQLAGLGIAVLAFAALTFSAASDRGFAVIEPSIFALGVGFGLVTPNMTIAVQNAVPAAHRGVGTATLALFRSLGGLVGVTGAGAILAQQLHHSAAALRTVGALSPAMQTGTIALYRHAITMTFAAGVVVAAVALGLLLLLPEIALSGRPEAQAKRSS